MNRLRSLWHSLYFVVLFEKYEVFFFVVVSFYLCATNLYVSSIVVVTFSRFWSFDVALSKVFKRMNFSVLNTKILCFYLIRQFKLAHFNEKTKTIKAKKYWILRSLSINLITKSPKNLTSVNFYFLFVRWCFVQSIFVVFSFVWAKFYCFLKRTVSIKIDHITLRMDRKYHEYYHRCLWNFFTELNK